MLLYRYKSDFRKKGGTDYTMLENANRTTHYIRTDKAIVQTFCQLLKRKPYEKITVQDILDATPISRAAFYQHFADKEAIGEQMMEEYVKIRDELVAQMAKLGEDHYISIVKRSSEEHGDLVAALMKIHTPRVDLASALTDELKARYKQGTDSPYADMEAQVYAAALGQYQVATMQQPADINAGDATLYNHVMIEVFLTLMQWQKDDAFRKLLYGRLRKMPKPTT